MKPLQNEKDRLILKLVRSAPNGFHVHSSGAIEFNDRKDREGKIEQSFKYLRNLPRRR